MGYYDILEPISNEVIMPQAGDLVVVPGVVFAKDGYRIGYGGGFYDQFLGSNNFSDLKIIGVAHELQIVEKVPNDTFDVKIPVIITEEHRYITKNRS
jgi:5-formyltetrahydrofolate cyclo-ligase